jgi:hypothetical protein
MTIFNLRQNTSRSAQNLNKYVPKGTIKNRYGQIKILLGTTLPFNTSNIKSVPHAQT